MTLAVHITDNTSAEATDFLPNIGTEGVATNGITIIANHAYKANIDLIFIMLEEEIERYKRQNKTEENKVECTCSHHLGQPHDIQCAELQAIQEEVDHIVKDTKTEIDIIWKHFYCLQVQRSDTAPGVYFNMFERAIIHLDHENGPQIIYDEPVSATTAHNYIEKLYSDEESGQPVLSDYCD